MSMNPSPLVLVCKRSSNRVLCSRLDELGRDRANPRLVSLESRNLVFYVFKVVHIENPPEQARTALETPAEGQRGIY